MSENTAEPSTPQVRRSGSRRPASADQERLVRRYLSALETNKAGRGVKRTADAIGNRITKVDELLVSADPLSRVHLTQERIELHAEYVRVTNGNHPDQSQLERDFVRVVRSYGDRNGITYAAWRQVGVDATILEQAGIHRADKKLPPAPGRRSAEAPAAAESRNGAAPSPAGPGPAALAPDVAGPDVAGPDVAGPDVAGPDVAGPDVAGPDVAGPEEQVPATAGLDVQASDVAGPGPDMVATATPGGEPTDPPAGEVSLDELADLLAEAAQASSASEGPSSEGPDQPRLGDDFAPLEQAPSNRPRRSPQASGS